MWGCLKIIIILFKFPGSSPKPDVHIIIPKPYIFRRAWYRPCVWILSKPKVKCLILFCLSHTCIVYLDRKMLPTPLLNLLSHIAISLALASGSCVRKASLVGFLSGRTQTLNFISKCKIQTVQIVHSSHSSYRFIIHLFRVKYFLHQ